MAYVETDGLNPPRKTVLVPTPCWSLVALLKAPPRAYGWCHTRWSCATLPLTLQAKRDITVSAETMCWRNEIGWEWKRPKLVAKDDAPQRIPRLARIWCVFEQLKADEALVFADKLDIHLGLKVGCAWMLQDTQLAVMTPGQNQQHYGAGALDLSTGTLHHCLGPRKINALFRDLLSQLGACYLTDLYPQLSALTPLRSRGRCARPFAPERPLEVSALRPLL